MIPLKTLKGSRIWYSKYGVGKSIGGKIYVHKNYAFEIIPINILKEAESRLMEFKPNFKYNCICWSPKEPNIVRFDEVQNFDTEKEPVVGKLCYVYTDFPIRKNSFLSGYTRQILHHKWLWVNSNYKGFDIQESYEWSKLWLSKFPEPASGYIEKWQLQLKKYLEEK